MTGPDPLADVFPDTQHAPMPILLNPMAVDQWGMAPKLAPHRHDRRWAPQPHKGTG